MPRVLTTNATITCPHGGTGTSLPLMQPPKVLAHNGAVLLDNDQGVIAGCANQVPCPGYTLSSLQLNACFVDSRHIMLVTDFIQSYTGFPLTVQESHSVFDGTTPAALPPSGQATIPPELREDDQPQATVMPPQLPFSISGFSSTSQPTAVAFTFSLQSQFPRRWTLWHLGPPNVKLDVMNGLPPNVVVAPPGGVWSTPALVVSLTILGTYASSLTPGKHSFVLTAVNHRGLWSMAEANLMVSA